MKALWLIAASPIMSALLGCQSAEIARVEARLDAQIETMARIERQTPELLQQLQARENAIKTLESEVLALSREQAALECLLLSERAHSRCMSAYSTLTNHSAYAHRVKRCARLDPHYRPDPSACRSQSAKLQKRPETTGPTLDSDGSAGSSNH